MTPEFVQGHVSVILGAYRGGRHCVPAQTVVLVALLSSLPLSSAIGHRCGTLTTSS